MTSPQSANVLTAGRATQGAPGHEQAQQPKCACTLPCSPLRPLTGGTAITACDRLHHHAQLRAQEQVARTAHRANWQRKHGNRQSKLPLAKHGDAFRVEPLTPHRVTACMPLGRMPAPAHHTYRQASFLQQACALSRMRDNHDMTASAPHQARFVGSVKEGNRWTPYGHTALTIRLNQNNHEPRSLVSLGPYFQPYRYHAPRHSCLSILPARDRTSQRR